MTDTKPHTVEQPTTEPPAPGDPGLGDAADITAEFDDLTLVVRAQEGDTYAFATLVRRHQRKLYRLAARLLDDPRDAEDAVQEAFVTAWRRLEGFRGDAAFSSWMYRIVTNRCLKMLSKRRPAISLDDLEDRPGPDRGSPEQAAETGDRAAALQRALQNLPADQRACWVLRELHGLSYEDIADIVGSGPDAVRGRLHRARRKLAEVMTPWR
ncbi:MAG: RNA polymerase sigma factor [Pseudonocardiaceae bacterium]